MFTCVIVGIEILIAFLLQTTVFAGFSIVGAIPNILMIVTSACGYQFGKLQGMACGFFCGILLDISSSNVLGVHALFFLLIGYMNGFLHKYYVKNDVFVPLGLVASSQLLYCIGVYIFEFLIRSRLDVFTIVKKTIIPSILYTTIISILVYRILDSIYNGIILKYYKREEQ